MAQIGIKDRDENGWYIIDDNEEKVYLKKDKDRYFELAKKYGFNKTLDERMSMKAKHILWTNTDYK